MCRLLGVVSAQPISVFDAVGAHVLKDFVALTKVHGDGWGVARTEQAGQAPGVEVSPGSALDDPAFAAAVAGPAAVASVVHLRWATNGLAVEPRNSHPFVADGIAMAHNGSIKPAGPLDELLDPEVAAVAARHHGQRTLFRHHPSAPSRTRRIWRRRSAGRSRNCDRCIRRRASTRSYSARDS